MSEAVVIKTHEHIKRIAETDISQASAEAIVNMATDVFAQQNLATKGDIEGLQKDMAGVKEQLTELGGRVTNIENNMATKADIANAKTDLTWRLIGLLIPFAALIIGGFFTALEIYRP